MRSDNLFPAQPMIWFPLPVVFLYVSFAVFNAGFAIFSTTMLSIYTIIRS